MDLAYLRAHPEHLPTFLFHQRIRETPVHGGSIAAASRLTLEDGASVFLKTWRDASSATSPDAGIAAPPAGFFEAERAGLDWLRDAGGAPVPEVVAATADLLALGWLEAGAPSAGAARTFGSALAATHAAGANGFGAAWAGFLGALPMDNSPHTGPWSRWFAAHRIEPFLRLSIDRGALSAADATAIGHLVADIAEYAAEADAEPPARIHGDLWPGNLLWTDGGPVYLIDPAAHGGHRETDLATLALFGGAPHLAAILDGYQEVSSLTPGWERRRPLHQLPLLLAHTAMFGSGYRDSVMAAVRATVDQ